MDELTKIVLQAHTEALIQILYRLPNPPKSIAAKLYTALEKLGGSTPRSKQQASYQNEIIDNDHQLDTNYSPQPQQAANPTAPTYHGQHITPAMAETMLQEAHERQRKAREQRTRHRLNEEAIRPENDLSDF